ncbi:SH3-domain kinase binding protein 1 [Gryganskiella cystojenkinii]|nr:SH3-domain kinase binding protein 1 [Gryganskiella cystojenkinii]
MAATTKYVVHHRYDAEKDDELTLEVGDIINVQDLSDPGWWVGERVKDGKAGWFPCNFVDPYDENAAPATVTAPVAVAAAEEPVESASAHHESTEAAPEAAAPAAPKHDGPVIARVEYDYEAKESGELSLEAGRVVTILDQSDPAWWTGDLNGKVGAFPSNYVKILENKEESGEGAGDKPAKFRLAAFGVKQGGLGSLFAGGVVPGLKKTGGLKKVGVDTGAGQPTKRTSIDEPRSPVAAPPKMTPPVAQDVIAPLINPTSTRAPPHEAPPPPPAAAPVAQEVIEAAEPRVPSRAKKPKVKQLKAVVIYEYAAQDDDEITLEKGSTVVVTDKMGDEGWWCGRNEQGDVGNFPSDFVQEIKEEAVLSPKTPVAVPSPITTAPASVPAPVKEEAPKSPVLSRHAVPLPSTPVDPIRTDLPRARTNDTPLATPPAFPRGSRPPSMIASPTPSASQLYDHHRLPLNEGPPLPGSPPPKRMSIASRSNSHDVPGSPRLASISVFPNNPDVASSPTSIQAPAGDLSRTSTLRRPQKPIPEAPLKESDESEVTHEVAHETSSETHTPPVSNSNRNSYILPAPVSRRPLPALARPPSIHQMQENRRSIVGSPPVSHLPAVPSEPEHVEEAEEEEAVVAAAVEPVHLAAPATASHHLDEEDVPVESPEAIHAEAAVAEEEHVPEPAHEEPVAHEIHEESEAHETAQEPAVEEEETHVVAEEKEPEKPKLPEIESSGPTLSHASRPRPAKGRKPPSAPVPNAENTSFVSQLEADVKAAPIVEEKKSEPAVVPAVERAAPPPKPMKPIFQKFPTPFAGAQPPNVALRPTGRRQDSNTSDSAPASSSPPTQSSPSAGAGAAPTPGAAPAPGGVKSLGSRFGQFQGVPASGGNSAALELEIAKLRRWMTEELDRVKRELSDEREQREKLEHEVKELKSQLQG